MTFLRRLFRRQPQTTPSPSIDVLIASRAQKVGNRKTATVSAYRLVHSVLATGVRRG